MSPPFAESVTFASDIRWCVFHGEATTNSARVYLRRSDRSQLPPGDWVLQGELDGPYCELSATLPSPVRFRDAGPGDSLLAQGIVVDPCFWTPYLPAWYRVRLTLARRNARIEEPAIESDQIPPAQLLWGIRGLGARGRNLIWNSERYVFRAIGLSTRDLNEHGIPTRNQFLTWRDTGTSLWLTDYHDEITSLASLYGVPVILDLADSPNDLELRSSILHQTVGRPAVSMVLLDRPSLTRQLETFRTLAPNLLFAGQAASVQDLSDASPDVWVWPGGDLPVLHEIVQATHCPVIACALRSNASDIRLARAACDQLQRDLAPRTDLAGYVIR